MSNHAAVTVLRPRGELERLWNSPDHRSRYIEQVRGAVRFANAPGDRGTEIHVDLPKGGLLNRLIGAARLARVKDELRRFKQSVETGEIARSDFEAVSS
jgi:uncharacterized membrane protein